MNFFGPLDMQSFMRRIYDEFFIIMTMNKPKHVLQRYNKYSISGIA